MMQAPGFRCGRAALMIQKDHRRVEFCGRDIEDRGLRLLPAGVADNDVEASKALHGVRDQLLTKGFIT